MGKTRRWGKEESKKQNVITTAPNTDMHKLWIFFFFFILPRITKYSMFLAVVLRILDKKTNKK